MYGMTRFCSLGRIYILFFLCLLQLLPCQMDVCSRWKIFTFFSSSKLQQQPFPEELICNRSSVGRAFCCFLINYLWSSALDVKGLISSCKPVTFTHLTTNIRFLNPNLTLVCVGAEWSPKKDRSTWSNSWASLLFICVCSVMWRLIELMYNQTIRRKVLAMKLSW